MNSFNFKLVNEDQLMSIVKQVKREKRRKRDDDERKTFLLKKEKRLSPIVNVDKVLSGENEIPTINCPSPDSPCKYRDSRNSVKKCHQKSNTRVHLPLREVYNISSEQMQSTYDHIKYPCVQCCSTHNLKKSGNEKVVTLMRNIQILRKRFIRSLDAFFLQQEQNLLKEKLFKNSSNTFKEIQSRKIMGCQYQILKLDYQLVLDMKKLNHSVTGRDIQCLLKVLSKCHSTALKIFQVFLRGLPEILEMEREKNKFCELLKCMVILSNVCKFLRININEVKNLKDFLVDDLNKRCKSLLYTVEKKMITETQDRLQRKMKTSKEWNMQSGSYKPFKVSETTKNRIQMMPSNKIHISKKSFRKIAKKVFGAQEQSRSSKDNGATKFEDNNFVRVIELPKVRNKNEEISKNQDVIHKIDGKNDLASNFKLREGSNIDLGLNCISVGTQYSPLLENNVENFNVESFSKKLYTVLETELNNNFQNIFQHLSKDQCHIKDADKKDLQIEEEQELKNSDSVNTFINVDNTIFSDELFQARDKNENENSLKQHKEAFELDKDIAKTGEVFRKQSKENNTLSNDEKNSEVSKTQNNTGNKELSSRYCNVLPIGGEYSSNEQQSQHQFLQEINTDLKNNCKHKLSSFNSPSTEKYERNLPNKNSTTCFDNEPWKIIGR